MEENRKPVDILGILAEMRSGRVIQDINEKFNDVIASVLDTGQKGELTVKVGIKPSRMGMGGAVLEVELSHDVKTKKPEHDIGTSVFFVTAGGDLSREDPDQTAMFEQYQKDKEENLRGRS